MIGARSPPSPDTRRRWTLPASSLSWQRGSSTSGCTAPRPTAPCTNPAHSQCSGPRGGAPPSLRGRGPSAQRRPGRGRPPPSGRPTLDSSATMPIHPPHIHGPIVAHACARQPAATEARARSRRGACRVARHLPTAAHVSVPAPSDAAERAASRRRTARASSGIPVRQHGFGTFGEGRRRAVARRPQTSHAPPFSTRPIVARGHPRQGRVRGCGGHRRPRGSGPPAESNRARLVVAPI